MNKLEILGEKVILGVDPGTNVMGYGVIEIIGSKIKLIQYGVIRLSKFDKEDQALRLKKIYDRTAQLIEEYMPDYMAIEAPFFGKNIQSMLKLGRAQGISLAAALARNIPIIEYSPKKIKQSVTGNGNASKEQVAAMIMRIFDIKEVPDLLDASDALAVALCHHYQQKEIFSAKSGTGSGSSWKNFVTNNPQRVK